MNCPKCKGALIEIKGNYFCSQCGTKVDLKELEEKLEKEVTVAKEEVAPFIASKESVLGKEKEASANVLETKASVSSSPTPSPSLENIFPPKAKTQINLESVPSLESTPEPQTTVLSSHKKTKLSPLTIRIFLIAIIALNILIILGLSYFFLLK